METKILEPVGYSKALENLLNIAKNVRKEYPNDQIVLLGGLLNAESVKKELSDLNIRIVDIPFEGFVDYVNNADFDTFFLTSPYGVDKKVIKALKKRKIRYIETTSDLVKGKINFINKYGRHHRIIYVCNLNTVEANYIFKTAKHPVIFYDVNNSSLANQVITEQTSKLNRPNTYILYQSELAGTTFDTSLEYLKAILPYATIAEDVSDENAAKKNELLDILDEENDIIIFAMNTSKRDEYLLDYYHLSTKKVLYAVIKDVNEAMNVNIQDKKRAIIITDGSLSKESIVNISFYFTYK